MTTAAELKAAHEQRKAKREESRRNFHAQRFGLNIAKKGEASAQARLTERQVRAIRKRAAKGDTQRKLAAHYGVSTVAIHRVIHRLSWAHVQ